MIPYNENKLYGMNNSLAEVHPELVSEWPEKNLTLNKRAYLIIRVSSNLFMEFPKAISMQEVLKSGFRHIL